MRGARQVPRRAAVLGSPIDHSLSPVLHAAAYRSLGLAGWSYGAHEVTQAGLGGFVRDLDPAWAGLSLTMPLKEVALEVADTVSDLARELGVANTLVRRDDGGWDAHNTDVHGVRTALAQAGAVASSAVVIGSGSTARSALAALADLGVREVVLVVRARARTRTLDLAERLGLSVRVTPGTGAAGLLASTPLVVNTVPAGGADALAGLLGEGPGPLGEAPAGQVLLDVVYDGWPTALATAFLARGATVAGGLEVLVHQAARQVLLMTGLEPPVPPMRDAGRAALSAR